MNDEHDAVERKVQLTGGSTYTVSLPKDWATSQDIEPGTTVTLYSQGQQVVITRGSDPTTRRHTTTIRAGERNPATLALAIGSAYRAGCDEIRIEDVRERTQRRAVTRAVGGFVGLEVITEDETCLVARTMLDVADLSPEQTLSQLERTTLEMHERAVQAVTTCNADLGEEIAHQDETVDRLFALVSRGFHQSLVDPSVTMGTEPLTPFEYYVAARQLERVADHAEKIATTATRLSDPPPEDLAETLLRAGEQSRELLQRALSGLLTPPREGSDDLEDVLADTDEVLTELAAMDEQVYRRQLADSYLLGLAVDSLVRTTRYGRNIAESALVVRHRG